MEHPAAARPAVSPTVSDSSAITDRPGIPPPCWGDTISATMGSRQ